MGKTWKNHRGEVVTWQISTPRRPIPISLLGPPVQRLPRLVVPAPQALALRRRRWREKPLRCLGPISSHIYAISSHLAYISSFSGACPRAQLVLQEVQEGFRVQRGGGDHEPQPAALARHLLQPQPALETKAHHATGPAGGPWWRSARAPRPRSHAKAREQGVGEHLPQQDALRDELQARHARRHVALKASAPRAFQVPSQARIR